MIKIDRKGCTRIVILTKTKAWKIPNFTIWRMFLYGFLGNMQERKFNTLNNKMLCPVLFSAKCGILVVMRRCRMLTREEWNDEDIYQRCVEIHENDECPVELKMCSFGWLDDSIVAVDYGS